MRKDCQGRAKDISLTLRKVIMKNGDLHLHKISISVSDSNHSFKTVQQPTIKNTIACFYGETLSFTTCSSELKFLVIDESSPV